MTSVYAASPPAIKAKKRVMSIEDKPYKRGTEAQTTSSEVC